MTAEAGCRGARRGGGEIRLIVVPLWTLLSTVGVEERNIHTASNTVKSLMLGLCSGGKAKSVRRALCIIYRLLTTDVKSLKLAQYFIFESRLFRCTVVGSVLEILVQCVMPVLCSLKFSINMFLNYVPISKNCVYNTSAQRLVRVGIER